MVFYSAEMRPVPVRLPEKVIEGLDILVKEGLYANRNAAIRVIVTHHLLNQIDGEVDQP